jgi:hypothetical protein
VSAAAPVAIHGFTDLSERERASPVEEAHAGCNTGPLVPRAKCNPVKLHRVIFLGSVRKSAIKNLWAEIQILHEDHSSAFPLLI